ncbi:MAG: hypothetical protein LBV49_01245, partial [Azonexus sp.]|nr:hypothetical protein [Azonexus sp.]
MNDNHVNQRIQQRPILPSPLTGEQPCSSASIFYFPWGVIFDHGIHDGEQFTHTGDDDDFG